MSRIIVGITGASGAVYGVRLLEVLHGSAIETHLVVSEAGKMVVEHECGLAFEYLASLAARTYHADDFTAALASGSFQAQAMVIVPCSMKTMGLLSQGIAANLMVRAAECMLKEGRKLVLVPRETPLTAIHLENMLRLARIGAHILPASPGFYHLPATLQEAVDMVVGKICDLLAVEHRLFKRWEGPPANDSG
ncbi:MAG TPA: UbiX family flavin prenyltransferase [Negativicutes bacterium]|nr:UbiX family flavin prenyltransferase [Negativicutes bacterium]